MPPRENITVMHRVPPGTRPVGDHGSDPCRNTIDVHQVRDAQLMGLRYRQRGRCAADRERNARDVRIVLGGVAPIPWRSEAAEREVEGRALDRTIDRVSGTRVDCRGSSSRAQRVQAGPGEEAGTHGAHGAGDNDRRASTLVRPYRRPSATDERSRDAKSHSRKATACSSSSARASPRIRPSPPG